MLNYNIRMANEAVLMHLFLKMPYARYDKTSMKDRISKVSQDFRRGDAA